MELGLIGQADQTGWRLAADACYRRHRGFEDTRHRSDLAAGKLVDLLQSHVVFMMAEKEGKNE